MDKLTRIDWGNDSTVYRPGNEGYVIKVYDALMDLLGTDSCLKMLHQYSEDTLRATEAINYKWEKSFRKSFYFDSKHYDTTISILPQGNIQLMPISNTDVPPRGSQGEYVTTVGQRFVEGLNVSGISNGYDWNTTNSVFHRSINTFESSMSSTITEINKILYQIVKVPFEIEESNIKPLINESKQTIDFVITDLAGYIPSAYKQQRKPL